MLLFNDVVEDVDGIVSLHNTNSGKLTFKSLATILIIILRNYNDLIN